MADKAYVTITLRKEVQTKAEAKTILDLVKEKLDDHPDVDVQGQFNHRFDLEAS